MYFSAAVVAAFALTTSASPLVIRGNTCGAAPFSSNSDKQPLSQPSDCQTSADCQTRCEADSSCNSFCFGLVDNNIQCKLYAVPAASVPKQPSANIVVYDKGCSGVPQVVPTSGNPTGKKVDGQQTQSNSDSGSKTSGQQPAESKKAEASKPTEQNQQGDSSKTSEQKPKESKQASNDNKYSQKQTSNGNSNSDQQKQTSNGNSNSNQEKQSSSANTCGAKPSASTNNQPISKPAVDSQEACKAKCQADNSCKSFTCGKVDNALVCQLFSVPAAQVPPPSNAAQKNALQAYDVGCSL